MRRAVIALVVIAAAGIGAAVTAIVDDDSSTDERDLAVGDLATVAVPRTGDARAMWLDDGSPVWVVNRSDGSVLVFDARSPHARFGIGQLVGWCAVSDVFEDPGGSVFGSDGAPRAGPAPWGLTMFTIRIIAEGRSVLILAPGSPVPRSRAPAPAVDAGDPPSRQGQGVSEEELYESPSCLQDDRFGLAVHGARGDPSAPEEVVGEAALPVTVAGYLDVRATRPSRLCSDLVDGHCPEDAPIVAGVTASEEVNEFVGEREVLLVRPSGGVLAEPTRFISID